MSIRNRASARRNPLAVPLVDGRRAASACWSAQQENRAPTPQDTQTPTALAGAARGGGHRERGGGAARSDANQRLQNEGYKARLAARIVGGKHGHGALRDTVERVARTDLPVLILGASGTGKDVVARATHHGSPRHSRPFLPVNCAAISRRAWLESELFGHEKAPSPMPTPCVKGKFELAIGGTLFPLDEIGDMSAGGQAKSLRVLEEKTVKRVGGLHPIAVDVRIVAATNRQLAEAAPASFARICTTFC